MKYLTELGILQKTDKADYHQFTEFYHDYFEALKSKNESPKILEIGILDGGSLRMYDQFFENKATIFGLDTAERGYLFNGSKSISTIRGDILMPETIQKCQKHAGDGYDIIIDDGGHTMEQQQRTLLGLWAMLKPGGYFIIEDLHTSGLEDYNPDNTTTTLAMLRALGDNRILSSEYITHQQMSDMNDEMESVLIWENEFPQVGTQQPRSSITSIIVKKLPVAAESNLADTTTSSQTPPPQTESINSEGNLGHPPKTM